jgi:hypothetical protein
MSSKLKTEEVQETEKSTCKVCHSIVIVSKIYDSHDKILKTVELDPAVGVYIVVDRGNGTHIAKKADSSMAVHLCDKIRHFTESCKKRQEEYDIKHPQAKRMGQRAA